MKKKYLKYIILFSIFILILIIIISIINHNKYSMPKEFYDSDIEISKDLAKEQSKIIQKINTIEFDQVRTCLNSYFQDFVGTNPSNIISDEMKIYTADQYKERIFAKLSQDYITKNSYSKEKLVCNEKITSYNVDILSIYSVNDNTDLVEENFSSVKLYIVKGIFRNMDTKTGKDFTMLIALDNSTKAFEIWPSDYVEMSKFESLKVGDTIDFSIPKTIEATDYNKFSNFSVSVDDICRYQFNTIIDLILYDTSKAYSLLSEKGRSTYPTISDLEKFRDDNKNSLAITRYSSNVQKLENGVLTIDCYNSSYNYKISIIFDEFSSFTYSIEKIEN